MRGLKRGMKQYPVLVGVIGIIDRMQTVEEATLAMDFFLNHKTDFIGIRFSLIINSKCSCRSRE